MLDMRSSLPAVFLILLIVSLITFILFESFVMLIVSLLDATSTFASTSLSFLELDSI